MRYVKFLIVRLESTRGLRGQIYTRGSPLTVLNGLCTRHYIIYFCSLLSFVFDGLLSSIFNLFIAEKTPIVFNKKYSMLIMFWLLIVYL